MTRSDAALFKQQTLTAGGWRNASDGARFAVQNPANAEIVGHAPRCTIDDVERAIEAVHAAFPACPDA